MGRKIGTVSMGVRAPIIKQGDPLADIVTDAIVDLTKEGIVLHEIQQTNHDGAFGCFPAFRNLVRGGRDRF